MIQFFNQRLRLLQVCCVETFGKPVVDLRQRSARFVVFALLLPETSETHGCAEFPGFRLLTTSESDSAQETVLCLTMMIGRERSQQLSFDPAHLRFCPAFIAFLHERQSLSQHLESLLDLSTSSIGISQQGQEIRQKETLCERLSIGTSLQELRNTWPLWFTEGAEPAQ